ncbi:MAG: hypothetical protein FD123_1215 [Bacteroidetes bacterium]|nr:MAG: hypothetical protein FD123_1215 [Bacteroidota bacterium]
MIKRCVISLFLAGSAFSATAQVNTSKLCLGAAFDYSVINNRKEVRGQYKPGINLRMMYLTRSFFGISAEYTHHVKHNTVPALRNITSWNADLNGHFICNIGESDLKFTALFGVDYLRWEGTYVGPSLNDNNKYYYGMILRNRWIGANMGCGFSHDITKRVHGFGEFKVRMATEGKDDLFGVADASFNFGVRVNILEIGEKDENSEKSHRERRHTNPNRKYKWLPK